MRVGDYVRTKKGYITKIFECYGKDEGYKNMEYYSVDKWLHNDGFIIYEEDIKKSSPNIIDLIEVGDVIRYKDEYGNVLIRDVHNSVVMYDIKFKNIEVLSIVTKEQFKSIEYEVKQMKITMYELLGLVKDGKAPKKVRYRYSYLYKDFKFDGETLNYISDKDFLFGEDITAMLNDEVEILEEDTPTQNQRIERLNLLGEMNLPSVFFKVNEIIDYLKYIKSKGDE